MLSQFLSGTTVTIPRLYSSIAEWSAALLYALLIPGLKKPVRQLLLPASIALLVQSVWMVFTGTALTVFWIPIMLISIFLMYALVRIISGAGRLLSFYNCMKAFLLAEFMASFEWQLEYFLSSCGLHFWWLSSLLILLVYGSALFLTGRILWRLNQRYQQLEVTRQEMVITLLIVLITFTLSNLSFIYSNTPFSGSKAEDINYVRTLVDICGLLILLSNQSYVARVHEEQELSRINAMLKEQYDGYRAYQENVDLINMKYHDLKHQIIGLRSETDSSKRSEWIDSMEKELESYRPKHQTGSQVLDGLIDAKRSTMEKNHVSFTVVADGSLLEFIHVTDLCNIFGNALDNAVESVMLVPDPENRNIHLQVLRRKNFVYIEVSNYCMHSVKLDAKGFPLSSKNDPRNHGFGVRSIAYAVQKYHGTIRCGMRDHTFEMKMLIPIPEEEKLTSTSP